MRVTAGGLMPPRRVLIGTYVAFGVAVACGLYLTAEAGWEILVIGVASIVAGVLYTGGPRPYGYEGLGELFVFLFFGVVAVTGSYFVQTEEVRWEAFALSVPVGLLASAILVVNNVRDVDTDRRAGKRTLAVKLGRLSARAPVRGDGAWSRCWCPIGLAIANGLAVGAAAAGLRAAGASAAADRGDPPRRPRAQRRAGRHRAAAGGLLSAAAGGACCSREALGCCGCASRCASRSSPSAAWWPSASWR